MEEKKAGVYLGIDINDRYAMVSYYQKNMSEPENVSTIAGSEVFQIPTILGKKKGVGQWYYGDDAGTMAKCSDMVCVDFLLKRAVKGEMVCVEEENYEAWELLALYLKKLIDLPTKLGMMQSFDRLIISVERLSKETMEVFWKIAERLEIDSENFIVIDHKESFYHFALSQTGALWIHDVYLFECDGRELFYYGLKRNTRTAPQMISIKESIKIPMDEDRDYEFKEILKNVFEGQIVSTAYLVGEGFEGGWMQDSLKFICKNRRVFMGNNLYCKGACYAGRNRDYPEKWNFIYMGEHEMKFNLSLKVRDSGNLAFYTLIRAGKNWFETQGECEVILSDLPEIEFWKQLPNSRDAVIETLELTDLPERPDRTTRLRITAIPLSDEKIEIVIKDLGFGEIYPAANKSWNYTMMM